MVSFVSFDNSKGMINFLCNFIVVRARISASPTTKIMTSKRGSAAVSRAIVAAAGE